MGFGFQPKEEILRFKFVVAVVQQLTHCTLVAAAIDSCIAIAVLTQLDDVSCMMSYARGSIQY